MRTLLTRLIESLSQAGLDDLGVDELAEVVWLAAQLSDGILLDTIHPSSEETELRKLPIKDTDSPLPVKTSQPFETQQLPEVDIPPISTADIPIAPTADIYTTDSHSSDGQIGIPFHSPSGYALPNHLQLTRILRPLRRRILSSNSQIIDEESTAQRIAETNVWLPVVRPQPVRWLELAIVIDQSPSMRIWARTISELRHLLEQLGAFRDIRLWFLHTDGQTQNITLRAYEGDAQRHYKELINPALPRLILLISDCVSPAWQGKELLDWTNAWGQKHPLGLVQMLPQELWSQTQLRTASHVKVFVSGSATANSMLRRQNTSQPWQSHTTKRQGLPLPVMTLEPESLIAWIRFITGAQGAALPAFIGEPQKPSLPKPLLTQQDENERLQQFRQVASVEAFQLACYLAAAPLRLPIMRLVQQVMLPQSRQTHLAEFFLSGLIRRISPPEVNNPDEVDYDFIGSLREQLLNYNLQSEAFEVQEMVSNFISEHYGDAIDFHAVLALNTEVFSESQVSGHNYFAQVRQIVLEKMGSQYLNLAMEQQTSNLALNTYQNIAKPKQKDLETSEFTEIGGSPIPGLTLRHVLRGHDKWIGRIAWSPDGQYLASPSADKTIRIWYLHTGECVHTMQGHTKTVRSVAWSPDGQRLASTSGDQTIRLWDVRNGKHLQILDGHISEVSSVAWSPDGRRLASASEDKTIHLWDPTNGKCLQTLEGHTAQINSVSWSPDGQCLASASNDRTIRLWDAVSGKHLQTLTGHTSLVYCVVWSPNGQYLASTSDSPDRTIYMGCCQWQGFAYFRGAFRLGDLCCFFH